MQMLNAHPRADCHQVGMNGQCSAIVIIMNLLHSGCLTSLTDMNSRVALSVLLDLGTPSCCVKTRIVIHNYAIRG